MTPRNEYLKQYHEEHRQECAFYKERQRARDQVVMFHVRRNVLYGYPLPETIAQDAERVERMRTELAAKIAEAVEVVKSADGDVKQD